MEKVAQDEIKTSIDEITASLQKRDNAIDAEIETIRSSVASSKNALTREIQQANVSWVLPIHCGSMRISNKAYKQIFRITFQDKLRAEFINEQEELKSKIVEISASVEEKRNVQPVIAFRATCTKNFPPTYTKSKTENPGQSGLTISSLSKRIFLVFLIKTILSDLEKHGIQYWQCF